MLNIPTDLLRTFIAVVETGSMFRASEQVCVTPSAVSLQVKRLEDLCRSPLFFRDERKLTLSPAGEILIDYARQILKTNDDAIEALVGERVIGVIRIGFVEDFAQTLLAGALRRFAALNPEAQIHLRVSGSRELKNLIAANRLDIALFLSPIDHEDVVAQRETHWFGDPALAEHEVLPLALLEKPCLFREQALQSLDEAGRKYEIVVETGSVSALAAAVEAGLGITPRINWGENQGMRAIHGMQKLQSVGLAITALSPPKQAITALRRILTKTIQDL